MRKLLLISLALIILSTSVLGALTASYSPPRMIKRVDVYPLYGTIDEGLFHVRNSNDFNVTITTRVSDNNILFLKEEDKQFTLAPGESRDIIFLMHITQVGNSSQNIGTLFSADDQPSMSGGSDIKIIATFKELEKNIAPKGNIFMNGTQGSKMLKEMEVMNPYNYTVKLSLETDEKFKGRISAEFSKTELVPGESTTYMVKADTKEPFTGTGKIYTVLTVKEAKVRIPTELELSIAKLKMNVLIGVGILLLIVLVGGLIFWMFMRQSSEPQAAKQTKKKKK
ncbi:hypothetical protein JW968_06415 [Candidatus Woesearchaeota archaeon]|nr:hypothetical protein [Candidatus Woesearchaeota archaeon]